MKNLIKNKKRLENELMEGLEENRKKGSDLASVVQVSEVGSLKILWAYTTIMIFIIVSWCEDGLECLQISQLSQNLSKASHKLQKRHHHHQSTMSILSNKFSMVTQEREHLAGKVISLQEQLRIVEKRWW